MNIEEGKTARIIVYEGDKSEYLSIKFATEHSKFYFINLSYNFLKTLINK